MKFIASIAIAITSAISALAVTPNTGDYHNQLMRLQNGETLTETEMETVYYGAAQQPGFNPEKEYTALEQAYSTGNVSRAYSIAKEILDKDPTDLSVLFKAYASAAATKAPDAKILQDRLIQICDVIFHSGKGVIDSSPYVITHRADLDQFLNKYIQPKSIEGRAKLADLDAVKVNLDGIPEPVILYFSTYNPQ